MFYLLAYNQAEAPGALARIRAMCLKGARLNWNMMPTVDAIATTRPEAAAFLRKLVDLMKGGGTTLDFDRLQEEWVLPYLPPDRTAPRSLISDES